MIPKKPLGDVAGDDSNSTMYKHGYIVGYTHDKVVWAFGFIQGTPISEAFGLAMEGMSGVPSANHMYVVADNDGNVLDSAENPRDDGVIPENIKKVLDAPVYESC